MTQAAAVIEVVRLPDERELGCIEPLACGCSTACCCCCCCLHSVGSLVGALSASTVSAAPPKTPLPKIKTPPPEPTGKSRVLPAEVLRVLGAFAVFHSVCRVHAASPLPQAEFDRLAEALRAEAQSVWDRLFPDRRPEAEAWILDRLGMVAEDGLIPLEAMDRFRKQLRSLPARPKVPATGSLAQLWRLHLLYQEVTAAVEAGFVPAGSLERLREHVLEQAMRVARPMDLYRGSRGTGRFRGDVVQAARALLARLEKQGALEAARRRGLDDVLEGRVPGALVRGDGACPICGDLLSGFPSVHCAACETPHHRQCWTYNKRCATFACGSLDVLEDGRGADKAVRYDLTQGSASDREASPEAQAVGVYWTTTCLVGISTLIAGGPMLLLVAAPFVLGAGAILSFLVVFLIVGPGRGAALGKIWEIFSMVFVGGILGFFANFLAPFLLPLFK